MGELSVKKYFIKRTFRR